MKTLLALGLIVGGIVLGVWLGVFVMFIGGIVQIINSFPHQVVGGYVPVDALGIASGLARVFFSGLVGWFSAIIMIGSGAALLG